MVLVEEANVLVAKILHTLVSPPPKLEENLQPSQVIIASNDRNANEEIATPDSGDVIKIPAKLISKFPAKAATKTTSKSTGRVATSKGVSKLAAKKATKKK
jgi:hypothetical protein